MNARKRDEDQKANTHANQVNAQLGLKGLVAQYAQMGFGGVMILAFGYMLYAFRTDAKQMVNELLHQQSVERAEDRELRKETSTSNSEAMRMVSKSLDALQREIKNSDDKHTKTAEKLNTTMEKLNNRIDRMPE